jgi:hypothetical protein
MMALATVAAAEPIPARVLLGTGFEAGSHPLIERNWEYGPEIAADVRVFPYGSFRSTFRYQHFHLGPPDECANETDGDTVDLSAGFRFDLFSLLKPRPVRPFVAASLGFSWAGWQNECSGPHHGVFGLIVEPAIGVDISLAWRIALRAEFLPSYRTYFTSLWGFPDGLQASGVVAIVWRLY